MYAAGMIAACCIGAMMAACTIDECDERTL
jgi:hypothetical protein